jgi:HEAT repeat protein
MSKPEPTTALLETARAAASRGDEAARWDAVAALQRGGDDATFDACARLCRSTSPLDRALAADVLGQLGGSGDESPFRECSCARLLDLLGDTDARVLASATVALGHLAIRDGIEPLLELARHASTDVRHGVALALSGNDAALAVAGLVRLSADVDPTVRDWATFALGAQTELDTPGLRDALVARLDDPHDDTRAEALAGLARRGDARANPAILRELTSGTVGRLAVEAARDAPSATLLDALVSLTSWWDVDSALLHSAIERCREAGAR